MKTAIEDLNPEKLKEVSELTGQLAENLEEQEELESKEESDKKSFPKILVESGYGSETLITDKEGFNRITTEKRIEILENLNKKDIDSVKELADELNRDRGNLSRDLDILFQEDMIEYQRTGKKKKPVLKHTRVVPKPVEIG